MRYFDGAPDSGEYSEKTAVSESFRILIVEDEPAMRTMLSLACEREGYAVRALMNGAGLESIVRSWDPDLVLLDIGLPGADGIALLPVVRSCSDVPVMMLTARTEARDKIAALGAGADHYVEKPVVLDELLARISAALRRPALAKSDALTFDDLTLEPTTRNVRRGDRRVDLTPREFAILEVMVRTPARAFSKDELIERVWGHDYDGDGGVVDRYISYLRAKLESGGETRLVQTVRGVGFALRRPDRT
jgi:two-component system response regulator MprA